MSASGHRRVLTVDDSRAALNITRRLLAGSDFEVVGEARGGTEAVEKYRRLSPDVVLLDIFMPGLDGVKVLEQIRGIDPAARVVMLSSIGTPEKVRECTDKGAQGFVTKPCTREELLHVLGQAAGDGALAGGPA